MTETENSKLKTTLNYDPIKNILGKVFNKNLFLRILFYKLLDLLLLRTWHIKKVLKKWLADKKNINILDAGSGFGQYSYFLSSFDKSFNILGVDVKKEQIDDCNNFFKKIGKKNITFETTDLTTFQKPYSFDLILCVDVMEHIEEDVKVFENFYASLKMQGMLLISTPSDIGGSDAHDSDDESFIGEHVRNGYNNEDIKNKLLQAGFNNIEVNYSYGKPGKLSWLLSMKYPILLLHMSKLFLIILPFYYIITFPFSFVLNYFDVASKHKSGTGLIVKAEKL
ncbi:MAG: class I SAM-dependent methyltransferase [Bacteroidales bacterium]|jgi:2-polyprenyl-3-methyl-5-hydroxy-6-metoxy-1,4-benzoquinol methylase